MSRTRPRLRAVSAAAAVLVLLGACSSGAEGAASTDDSSAAATQAPAAQQGERPGGGTTGEIAAVSDALLQVQGADGQTAVTWDGTTAISQTVAAALADVTVGTCVVATTSGDDDAAAATSMTITAATDGECATGLGGGAGGGVPGGEAFADGELPDGVPTGMPEMPDGAPTGGTDGEPPAGGGFGGITAGLVTAVDSSTITVASGADGTASTITVDDATTYTSTVAADATAIAVGRCVTAQGESDSSGQVAATALVLSDATDDGCSTGFGGRGGTPPGDSAAASEGEGSDA
jgi:hypothetical protein